jgi:hypothetical protein
MSANVGFTFTSLSELVVTWLSMFESAMCVYRATENNEHKYKVSDLFCGRHLHGHLSCGVVYVFQI